jgi:hypothetical protein
MLKENATNKNVTSLFAEYSNIVYKIKTKKKLRTEVTADQSASYCSDSDDASAYPVAG